MLLDKNCCWDPCSKLGRLEPVVVYYNRDGRSVRFHITQTAYAKLNAGCGVCYGRTPDGPFCRLKIRDYRVFSVEIVRDPAVLQMIHEDLFT